MYVVSMFMEHISSFIQFGKRRKMFSRGSQVVAGRKYDSLLHNDMPALPRLNPVSGALCLTPIGYHETQPHFIMLPHN